MDQSFKTRLTRDMYSELSNSSLSFGEQIMFVDMIRDVYDQCIQATIADQIASTEQVLEIYNSTLEQAANIIGLQRKASNN